MRLGEPKFPWSKTEMRLLLRWRDEGLSQQEIANRLGRSRHAINSRLMQMNPEHRVKKAAARKEKIRASDHIVEGIDEQPTYWRNSEAANERFLELLREHHPEHALNHAQF